ncbi:MAG: YybH family protein [Saprospiraceae bacterium]
MKSAFLLFTALFFSIGLWAQTAESKDFQAVRQVLATQQDAWNRGDIDAFMQYYWQSPDLQFIGSSGPTYGWQNTLERYKKTYSNRDLMGTLQFDILNLNQRSKKVISVLGKFTLQRKNDQPSGYFLLIFQKIKGKWIIVADHTS